MGYYWHVLDQRWIPRPRWEPKPAERKRLSRRRKLLAELVNEIEDHAQEPPEQFVGDDAEYFETTQKNERAAKLYARLLARALVGTHESLMREAGERVAQATDGGEKPLLKSG
jgi:hypothetical protein